MTKKEEKTVAIDISKKKSVTLHLVGDGPLVLCKKTKSFEQEEIFKQSHPKGTKIPDNLNSKLHNNMWEKLITSVTWEKPTPDHDNYDDYTEEEWHQLMETNRPCILSNAFYGSFRQAFKSYGYKEATGRDGTDFARCVRVDRITPVDITSYKYDMHLVPNNTVSHTNVLSISNVFNGWSCDLNIRFIESIFPLSTLLAIVGDAGEFLGIGTRRGDDFGQYHIDSVIQ